MVVGIPREWEGCVRLPEMRGEVQGVVRLGDEWGEVCTLISSRLVAESQ